MSADVTGRVKQQAAELGFALCGVCAARGSAHAEFFRGWLDEGKHGEMGWLAEHVDVRLDPGLLVEGARSIIVVADALPQPQAPSPRPHASSGRIAGYAQFSDYHKVLKKRLHRLADGLGERHPEHVFRVCVDTAPLLEREHAARAGLGWIGKHTLLLNRHWGSHLLLGGIVTTLELEPDAPATDHCGRCMRCIEACPTQCITPHSVDASRCISYLTIEHRSAIDPSLHRAMGEWLFGCDVCQEVCPYVRRGEPSPSALKGEGRGEGESAGSGTTGHSAAPQSHVSPSPNPSLGGRGAWGPGLPPGACSPYQRLHTSFSLLDVLQWTEDDRREAFRGSAMKRAKLDMIRRNALIVAGNRLTEQADIELRRRIERIATSPDEPEMVRATARDVLSRLD